MTLINIRAILTLLVISLLSFSGKSQVTDIRTESDNGDNSSTTRSETNYGSSSDESCTDACFGACFNSCLLFTIDFFAEHQKELVKKKPESPTLLSFDVIPTIGWEPNYNSLLFSPRIRGNFYVLGTDLRLFQINDFSGPGVLIFRNIEWQFLQLTIVPSDNFRFRPGIGILYENYGDKVFGEFSLSIDYHIKPEQTVLNFEGRFSADSEDESMIFAETSMSFRKRFISSEHMYGYAVLGGMYQNFYETVNLISVQGGLMFNLH